jgi:hypothetical protein
VYRNMKMWVALNAFTAVLKIFKFTQISRKMNSLWEVLQRAMRDLAAFFLILLFIQMAYATAGCVLFGDHIRNFHNIPSSMHTLLYFTIGDFGGVEYSRMRQASSLLAPWFMMTYLVLVALVSVNMFIAILSDAYDVFARERKQQRLDRRDSKSGNEAASIFSVGKRLHEAIARSKPRWHMRVQTVVTQQPQHGEDKVRQNGNDRQDSNGKGLDEEDDGLDWTMRKVCVAQKDTVRLHVGRSYLGSDKRKLHADDVVGNTNSAVLNGVQLLARFISLDSNQKQTSPHASTSRKADTWQSMIVLTLLDRHEHRSRGVMIPGRNTTRMLENLHEGEQIWIKDPANFLGNEVGLTYRLADAAQSTASGVDDGSTTGSASSLFIIDTPVEDLLTGRVVTRRDTYADFTVDSVFTLESQSNEHSLSCWLDPSIANLVIPYPLYCKLLARSQWKRLRLLKGCCSDLCSTFTKRVVNPCLDVRKFYLQTFRGQERVADLVEQYLDGKLRHVAAHKHDARFKQQFDDTWYDQEKRAFAAMDVTLADVPRQVRRLVFSRSLPAPRTPCLEVRECIHH